MTKHPFEYQKPTEHHVEAIASVREACKALYEVLLDLPNNRERSLAITKLEESFAWANRTIVLGGEV